MYNQQTQQLPFDPIALGILPAFVPMVPTAIDMLMQELTNKRSVNTAREAIFSECWQQPLQNPRFHQLLVTVSEYTMMMIDCQRVPPQQALQTAVVETLTMRVAMWYAANKQYITDQGMFDEVMATARNCEMICNQIASYVASIRQQMTPQQTWQQTPPQNWNTTQTHTSFNHGGFPNHAPAPAYGSYNAGGYGNSNGGYGFSSMHGGAMGGGVNNSVQHHHDRSDTRGFTSPLANNTHNTFQPVEVSHFQATPEPVRSNPRVVKAVRRVNVRGSVAEVSGTPKRTVITEPSQQPSTPVVSTNVSDQWRGSNFNAAVEAPRNLQHAENDGLTRTFTVDSPYAAVYDPSIHVLLHEQFGDLVLERLGNKGEEVDYLDHETDADNIRKIAEDQRLSKKERVIPLLSTIAVRKVNLTGLPQDDTGDVVDIKTPYHLEKSIAARDIDDAVQRAIDEIAFAELDEEPDTYSFNYHNNTPLPIDGTDMLDMLLLLEDSRTARDVINALVALKPLLPGQWYKTLDERMTSMVNDAVKHRMGIDIDIDSFVDDYSDLLDVMKGKYGSTVVDVVLEHEGAIISAFVSGMEFSKRKASSEYNDTVRFNWTDYVLTVPVTYKDLSLACNERSGAVIETHSPELYAALQAVLVNTNDYTPTIWARTIVTSDNYMFRIHQGYFNDAYIVLEFYRKP